MCEEALGILFLFSLVIGAIAYFCWMGGKMAEEEVRSRYTDFRLQQAYEDKLRLWREEQEKKLAVASIAQFQTVTLSCRKGNGWYCSFVDDGKFYRGFVSGLSEYGYSGQEIRAKVVRFDQIYFLEKA